VRWRWRRIRGPRGLKAGGVGSIRRQQQGSGGGTARPRRATPGLATFGLSVLLAGTLTVIASGQPPVVFAAVRTWDGGGLTDLWSDPLNWSSNLVPLPADTVVFDGTSVKNATINVHVSV